MQLFSANGLITVTLLASTFSICAIHPLEAIAMNSQPRDRDMNVSQLVEQPVIKNFAHYSAIYNDIRLPRPKGSR
jgi:hypothetical protein